MTIEEKLRRVRDDLDRMYNAGADIGYNTGYNHGKTAGVEEGITEGRTEQYNENWDAVQANGTRVAWQYGFYNWNIVGPLRPKHKISPIGAITQMFINNYNMTTVSNWGFPTSGVTSCQSVLAYCYSFLGFVDENGEIIKGKPFFGNSVTDYRSAFLNNESIEYICIDLTSVNNLYTNAFQNCFELKHMDIAGGTIESNGFSVKWSTQMDKESLEGIVNSASTEKSISITLSLTAVKREFETSAGANDGNTSQEWKDLVATRPTVTFALA